MGGNARVQLPEPSRTALYDQASTLQIDFDQQHDLGGLSYTKTWGLASWGPYVASCVSYHPRDMVEYTLASGERCHIFFSLEDTADIIPDNFGFSWQTTSDSAGLGTKISIQVRILKLINQIPVTDTFERKVVYSICCSVLFAINLQTLQLAEDAFRRLAMSIGISMEQELALLEDARISDISASQCVARLRHIAGSRTGLEGTSITRELWDLCSICDEVVVWINAIEAACVAGHQFGTVAACSSRFGDKD